MKLSRTNQLLIGFFAVAVLVLSACNTEGKRAMEVVDRNLKALGVKNTELSLFVVDPAASDRAYISLIATWNFANSAGQPQKENLAYVLKKNGTEWQIEKQGIKHTDDKNNAMTILKGGKF